MYFFKRLDSIRRKTLLWKRKNMECIECLLSFMCKDVAVSTPLLATCLVVAGGETNEIRLEGELYPVRILRTSPTPFYALQETAFPSHGSWSLFGQVWVNFLAIVTVFVIPKHSHLCLQAPLVLFLKGHPVTGIPSPHGLLLLFLHVLLLL